MFSHNSHKPILQRSIDNRKSKADKEINSDFIFNHKDMKPKTRGYDNITGEIKKRGKPKEETIFVKKPEDEPTEKEIKKERKEKEKKKLEAYNKKLYRDRLKQKWDRSW
mgnify:CR=1 FL=1